MMYGVFAVLAASLLSFACTEETTYPCGPKMNQQCPVDNRLTKAIDETCPAEAEKGDTQCVSPADSLASIDFSTMASSEQVDYFELRESELYPFDVTDEITDDDYTVINGGGELCAGTTDPSSCKQSFKVLRATGGFAWHAHPLDLVYYLAVNQGEDLYVVQTVEAVAEFLGTIESREEAMLLATAHGFYWGNPTDNDTKGIIKKVDNGFEMVVMQLVSLCDPIQTDRVWIRITYEGNIEEIDREIVDRMVGWCS
jgi:hypothetical protein